MSSTRHTGGSHAWSPVPVPSPWSGVQAHLSCAGAAARRAARGRYAPAACAVACLLFVLAWLLTRGVSRDAPVHPAPLFARVARRAASASNTTGCDTHWWVLQATKEYTGVASVGGAGAVLASLVSSTTRSACVHGTVIMPLYSIFTSEDVVLLASASAEMLYHEDAAADVLEDAREFNVYALRHSHALYADGAAERIQVLLVGPPTAFEDLAHVYSVPGTHALYESTHRVPAQVRDFVFAAQVVAVMDAVVMGTYAPQLQAAIRGHGGWVGAPPPLAVEVVLQLHGAPTALIAPMITQQMPPTMRPAIVYTMHDIAYEFLYRLPAVYDFDTAMHLLMLGEPFEGTDGAHATEVAFRYSDAITTVSTALRKQLADYSVQEDESPLRDVLCEALQSRRLHGINNALSDSVDPTQMVVHASLPPHVQKFHVGRVMESKRAAKEALVTAGVLPRTVGPIALFIGRFEGVKGFNLLPAAAEELCKHGAHLVVMGMFPAGLDASMTARLRETSHPLTDWQRQLLTTYARLVDAHHADASCPVTLIDTASKQADYGTLLRAAADVGIIPSLSEAFGLVAEEALLYGALPVVSNAGGLLDIVAPYSASATTFWNGIRFSVTEGDITFNLREGITSAMTLLYSMSDTEREEYASAVCFSRVKWTSDGGPMEQYLHAYEDAVSLKRDTNARLQLARMLPGVPCRQTTQTALDWSGNLVRWEHSPECASIWSKGYSISDSMERHGAAGFMVGPLPPMDVAAVNASVRQHLRARNMQSVTTLDSMADGIVSDLQVASISRLQGVAAEEQAAAQNVLLVTTSESASSGGATHTVKPAPEHWQRYYDHQAAMAAQARERALQHVLDVVGDAASERIRASIIQHYTHVLLARGEGSDMLMAVSAWSAPLTPLLDLGLAGYALRVDVTYMDGTRIEPLLARFPSAPLYMWSSRRIMVPLSRPVSTVKISLLLDGALGSVAFDEPDVRIYAGRRMRDQEE